MKNSKILKKLTVELFSDSFKNFGFGFKVSSNGFGSKKSKDSKGPKLSNRFSNKRSSCKSKKIMKLKKIYTKEPYYIRDPYRIEG